jgi:hypothetical protein
LPGGGRFAKVLILLRAHYTSTAWPRSASRPPPAFGDPHARDFDRPVAGNHALGRCRGEPGADQRDHVIDREAVREPKRLGAAEGPAADEQFERPAAIGLGHTLAAALMARHRHRWTSLRTATQYAQSGALCRMSLGCLLAIPQETRFA